VSPPDDSDKNRNINTVNSNHNNNNPSPMKLHTNCKTKSSRCKTDRKATCPKFSQFRRLQYPSPPLPMVIVCTSTSNFTWIYASCHASWAQKIRIWLISEKIVAPAPTFLNWPGLNSTCDSKRVVCSFMQILASWICLPVFIVITVRRNNRKKSQILLNCKVFWATIGLFTLVKALWANYLRKAQDRDIVAMED